MRYLNKLSVRVTVALAVGFLVAGAFTKIIYPCSDSALLGESVQGCVSFEKAIMHPSDLMSNKQGSLAAFLTTFALTSVVSFALLSVANIAQKGKT